MSGAGHPAGNQVAPKETLLAVAEISLFKVVKELLADASNTFAARKGGGQPGELFRWEGLCEILIPGWSLEPECLGRVARTALCL